MQTMTAADLIGLSQDEGRTVTEYPDSSPEWEALAADLFDACDRSEEHSGAGFSGPEARGWTDFRGPDWRVALVRPA